MKLKWQWVLAAGAAMLAAGMLLREPLALWRKGIAICLECVGIG